MENFIFYAVSMQLILFSQKDDCRDYEVRLTNKKRAPLENTNDSVSHE